MFGDGGDGTRRVLIVGDKVSSKIYTADQNQLVTEREEGAVAALLSVL